MTIEVSPIFIDTNVLVYANLAQSPLNSLAVQRLAALNTQGIDLWISRQALREYLSAMTRPGDLTGTIRIESLVADVRYFANRFHMAEDSPDVTTHLLNLMEQIPIGGRQVHDANIVATMRVHSIGRLLTHNTDDFARFSHLIEVIPLQANR